MRSRAPRPPKSGATPVGAAEFAKLMMPLRPASRCAVALSGGPDSLALLFLASRWARAGTARSLVAFTVDHGLRPESRVEAKRAADMAKALGVPHRILVWRGEKPKAGIQAAARTARYRLLEAAARAEGAGDILVAHTLEDQAETFLLRLARGSGVDGLAGMAGTRMLDGVRLIRPLLDVPRARLVATLEKAALRPILDPSNENERFDRVKARRMMGDLSALGLDARRLADTASHMARARAALEAETRGLLAAHARLMPAGHVVLDAQALVSAPEEIGLRALSETLKCVGGSDYPPRFEALISLYHAIAAGDLARGRTLNGCKITSAGAHVLVLREMAAALKATPLRLAAGGSGIWDGRFEVRLVRAPAGAKGGVEVRALGTDGLAAVRAQDLALPDGPKTALQSLPGLWKGKTLFAVGAESVVPGYRIETRLPGRGLLRPA